MPRKRQTAQGYSAQPAPRIAPQVYGQGVDMQQLDQSMPMPNMQTEPAPPPEAGGAAPPQPGYDHQAVLGAAQNLADQTGLLLPETARPGEPITAGLTRGPGAGPEALGLIRGTPSGDLLRRLSASTGDPSYAELARKAKA